MFNRNNSRAPDHSFRDNSAGLNSIERNHSRWERAIHKNKQHSGVKEDRKIRSERDARAQDTGRAR